MEASTKAAVGEGSYENPWLYQGTTFTSADIDDIKAMALPVLRHRVIPNFNAEAEGMKIENIISKLL